ncbi:hypothetical protein [Roseovarius sp. M141]|uniref:lipase/acyltransferase domain-containing protein n=1 Tax=Roseovarius sp. M141 TaxID=2583806 RepID=UPI0020CEE884|nr:hypothetical protein [Roseovarius sp. M141]MCQ0090823.1 alpha/beta hydrolase [Roseovarius sp. M141]
MKAAIVIPGIMGTRLHLCKQDGSRGEEVWPPKPSEVIFGYNRIADLQRADLVVGDIIDNILCYDFYNLMDQHLKALKYGKTSADRRQVNFAYDWRQDNFQTADRLAATLSDLHDQGAEEILLLAHSMGGMVARLMLEGGKFDAEPWFSKITLLATFGTPHLGAPLALARVFGMDSALGISGKDFAALAANRDYPSGYQLMPAPGEAAIWNIAGSSITPLDPYDPPVAADLGMDDQLVASARAVHDILSREGRPAHIRYAYFAGTGHQTATRVNVVHTPGQGVNHAQSVVTKTASAGDGTVPLYSAIPARGLRQIVVNEHATVFKGLAFKRVLFRLFGQDAGDPLEVLPEGVQPGEVQIQLSLDRQVYDLGESAELVMTIVDPFGDNGQADSIKGKLVLQKLDDDQKASGAPKEIPVLVQTAPVSTLSLFLSDIPGHGLYQLSFDGHPAAAAPVAFAVRQASS